MRVLGFAVLGLAMCGNVVALETSAGTDTVNSSQIGIDAKLDASNAFFKTALNNMLDCNKNGQLWTSAGCVAVDEPLAKKIADCTTNKKFYNQNTGACMDSAPDLTAQLNSTDAVISKLIACYNAHGTFNASTGQCTTSGSSVKLAISTSSQASASKGQTKYSNWVTADFCTLGRAGYDFTGKYAQCTVQHSGAQWRVEAYSNSSKSSATCMLLCYTQQ